MRSPKRLNPFTKSVASITNADLTKPPLDDLVEKKLFFPTFESRSSIQFWVGFVIFFSLLSLFSSLVLFQTKREAWVFFVEAITSYGFIVLLVVGYIHRHRAQLAQYNYRQTVQFFGETIAVLVPIATLLSSGLTYLITGMIRSWQILSGFIVSNMLLTAVFAVLLLWVFSSQYDKMRQQQAIYQQKLIEQNEQLKARITPHFFFNMLNTMQYLIETDTQQAEKMIQNVSLLYRASFDETKEIALLDEIALCQRYLDIEQYRFGNKLKVTWELPEEDLLYDMVISSLTLQFIIEKMIVSVVELTTQVINLNIFIEWLNDLVTIEVSVNIPVSNFEAISQTLKDNLNFDTQNQMLRQYFGKDATITYDCWIGQITTYIRYPLKDAAY